MKNLNNYGKEFIEKVKEGGKLEDIYDYYQVDNISVTQSQNNHLINMCIVIHTEEIYGYKNKKYKLDLFGEIACNELFTVSSSSTDEEKKELIEKFVENIYSNIFNCEIKEITEKKYNQSSDISKEEIKSRLKNAII